MDAEHRVAAGATTRAADGTAADRTGRDGRVSAVVLTVVWLAVAGGATAAGLDYYRTPLAERAWSEGHALYAPAGVVGHSLGIAGSLMMGLGVALYSIRKRSERLARVGRLSAWLRLHIFLCTLGPFLVLLHTSFKFGGIVSIAFWSMALVVASGVFGRYVYVRIPKTLNGRFRTLRELEARREALAAAVRDAAGVDPSELDAVLDGAGTAAPRGLAAALWQAFRFDLRERARARRVRTLLRARGVAAELRESVVALVREQARLEQQRLMLAPFQRMFRYWHTFHLPLAIVMFVILVVHVAVAVAFGYGWPL